MKIDSLSHCHFVETFMVLMFIIRNNSLCFVINQECFKKYDFYFFDK